MKYLCLCYFNTQKFSKLSDQELQEMADTCMPYDEKLRASGKLDMLGSLSLPDEWKTIQPKNGKPEVTNGPYVSEELQAGAFFIVDADSIEEAVDVASNHATANYGEDLGFAVEVRACDFFAKMDD